MRPHLVWWCSQFLECLIKVGTQELSVLSHWENGARGFSRHWTCQELPQSEPALCHCLGKAGAGEWNIRGSEEAAIPSETFKKAFSHEKATTAVVKFEKWKQQNSVLQWIGGEVVSTRTSNNRRRKLSFISTKLGTASLASEVLGTQQGCSYWDTAHHHCREAGRCFPAALSPPAQICGFSRLPSLPAYFCAGHSQVSHRWGCT